ncbi:MAG: hypothetical protein ACOX0U_10575 [Oscillospiraceae bacterium]
METKPIKLSPKKGGHGHITSYSVNIGSAEARECGFVQADGTHVALEKIVDKENRQVIIRIKQSP